MVSWDATTYRQTLEKGLCTRCGNYSAIPGKVFCEYCTEGHYDRMKKVRNSYFATPHGRAMRQARVAKRRGVWCVQYDVQIIWAKHEYQCFYKFPGCESFVRGEYMLTEDHVIPVYYEGPSMAFNILPACRSCNSYKKHRWLTELPFDWKNKIEDPNLLVALAAGPQLWTPKLLVYGSKAYNEYVRSLNQ